MNIKSCLATVLFVLSLLSLPIACGNDGNPEKARKKLGEMGLEYSEEAFIKSASNGDTIALELFLTAGMDVNKRDENGMTALIAATEKGRTEIIQLLIDKGADILIPYSGKTPLKFAEERGDTEAVQLLKEMTEKQQQQVEELFEATSRGDVEAIKILLSKGVNPNAKRMETASFLSPSLLPGMPVLTYAALEGHTEIVKLLLEKGANVNEQLDFNFYLYLNDLLAGDLFAEIKRDRMRDRDALLVLRQLNALAAAMYQNHTEIVEFLKKAGAIEVDLRQLSPLFEGLERSRRGWTMANMRAIGTGLGSYQVDRDTFPVQNPEADWKNSLLPTEYYEGKVLKDGWGTSFKYWSDGKRYTLISYGANKRKGEGNSKYDTDIVYDTGRFVAGYFD